MGCFQKLKIRAMGEVVNSEAIKLLLSNSEIFPRCISVDFIVQSPLIVYISSCL